jgi:glutamate dehydrogenase
MEFKMVLVTDSDKFIDMIQDEIIKRVRKEERDELLAFARLFFNNFPLEELRGRDLSDVFGVLYANWGFIQDFDREQPRISIYNPTLELNGWQSNKTIIQVLERDMPFLVGSILGELNAREIVIHTIHNTVVQARRDAANKLLEVKGRRDTAEGFASEAIIYLEITRNSSREFLDQLTACLVDILGEVASVVRDWQPMANVAKDTVSELLGYQKLTNQADQADQTVQFMEWMLANHFTFLGYQQLELQQQDGGDSLLRPSPGQVHGLAGKGYGELSGQLCTELLKKHYETPDELIVFGRYSFQSRVHRRSYPELILVWRYDDAGQLRGAHCFMGLFTSVVHTTSVRGIPVVSDTVDKVLSRAGCTDGSHNGREIIRILETLPRGELFHITEEQLYNLAMAIFRIRERRQVRLFMAVDSVFGFVSCLVYVPRSLFRTELRMQVQSLIADAVNAIDGDFTTYFSESVLARTHFLFRLSPGYDPQVDVTLLERELVSAAKSWREHLRETLVEELGEEQGTREIQEFIEGFSLSYEDDFEPRIAVRDIRQIRALSDENNIGMSFYRALVDTPDVLHFRLLREGQPLILSDVIPILENFGLRVVAERSYAIRPRNGNKYWLQEFTLQYGISDNVKLESVNEKFKRAFYRIWRGDSENDAFNRLLLAAELDWRQIALVRAYARYMKQLSFQFSEVFIADTLRKSPHIAASLVEFFDQRFNPESGLDDVDRQAREEGCQGLILQSLEQVVSLNEDRVIRHFLTLISATLRTNYYLRTAAGKAKNYISLKINTAAIDDAPLPRPEFEIFVYSPRMEGVHLRGGKVARGGLRWSDRYEDFRTEVLGLVKAQQVKNAIIVPVGAKGGFICKRQPGLVSREEKQQEAIVCYKTFISGLLDITDNLVEGEVQPPANVVRKDGDDVYLVVAADKGTATFSDIANGVAAQYGFWLGDAFASGGEYGYDHKKMGITARGAWVCVQRHFREMGIDIQSADFTVVGIGDMSGDVFGNGMLLSECIQLTAAFNHMHIFIDPNPDAASSFQERQRLFQLPRSSWSDYSEDLISKGGGIFSRSAKSIAISPQMRERFAIAETSLAPEQLVRALLKAPVDLLWNGGIGTYVKSSLESHTDVGDKANDAVRINANELGAKVVGEGGNLGITQLARVEYALAGGAVNTDFIDNAGGVNCSDHEVNIKILLDEQVRNGDLTTKQRNQLLVQMTDEVAALVLQGSEKQALALSVAHSRAARGMDEFIRFIQSLALNGYLNRELEFIPDDEVLRSRRVDGQVFTRPELAVLSAYSKSRLKETLIASTLPDDPTIAASIQEAFPGLIEQRFGDSLQNHRLRREIVAMRVANDMINSGGITFAHRMRESTGADDDAIARGFFFASKVFRLDEFFSDVAALDFKVDAAIQHQLLDRASGLLRGATRWFLRGQRYEKPLAEQIEAFSSSVEQVWENLSDFLEGDMEAFWQVSYDHYINAGVDEKLSSVIAGVPILYDSLNIVEAAHKVSGTALDVAQLYFHIGEELGLTEFSRKIYEMKVENHWQALAREGLIDDVAAQQKQIAIMVLSCDSAGDGDTAECLANWIQARQVLVARWRAALAELMTAPGAEFAMYSVVLRELANLARPEVG